MQHGLTTAVQHPILQVLPEGMPMAQVNFAGYRIRLPRSTLLRALLGVALIIGGFLGFLPVLGFWMIPLGVVVLSIDFPVVRRFRRNITVKLGYWLHKRWPYLARRFGYGEPRNGKIQ
jgi:purine-cytosine permease-like protein